MAPKKPEVEKPAKAGTESKGRQAVSTGPASPAVAPGKRGEPPVPKKKRRQGGRGRPFPKGQPDALPGKEHRWKKGQSGNPDGRPKTVKEVQERINARAFDLVDHLFDVADSVPMELPPEDDENGWQFKGPTHTERITAIRDLMHVGGLRTAKQIVEHSGPDGKPIQTENVGDADLIMESLRAMEQRLLKDQSTAAPAPVPASPVDVESTTDEETDQEDNDGTDPA